MGFFSLTCSSSDWPVRMDVVHTMMFRSGQERFQKRQCERCETRKKNIPTEPDKKTVNTQHGAYKDVSYSSGQENSEREGSRRIRGGRVTSLFPPS